VEIVKLLCEHGAAVDATNDAKQTALFAAARENRVAVIKLLTGQFGANVCHRAGKWPQWTIASKTLQIEMLFFAFSFMLHLLQKPKKLLAQLFHRPS
jgi:ankyrin repeat protein